MSLNDRIIVNLKMTGKQYRKADGGVEMSVEKCYGRRSKIATPGFIVIHFAWLIDLGYFRMSADCGQALGA